MASTRAVHRSSEPERTQRIWLRQWRAADGIIVAGAGIAALVLTGLVLRTGLTGWPVILWLLACVLVIPSARELSTRIVYNVVTLCAVTYLDWLSGLRLPGTHGSRLLSLASALAVQASQPR